MHRTLFLIPHELGPLPVFQWGWALIAVGVALVIRLGLMVRFRPASDENREGSRLPSVVDLLANEGLFWIAAAGMVVFVLPIVEVKNAFGEPIGLAIRGYGFFLILALIASISLAVVRVRRAGLNPDLVYSFAPWAFIGGILGARLFFVIQYRDRFIGKTFSETLQNMLAFTEGGLVIYGAFIGGFLAFVIFNRKHRLPLLRFGDAIIPCLFLGVFLGRIGCLMNGCCYGGRCEPDWASIRFPPLNKVYQDQLKSGELLGMNINPETGRIESLAENGIAEGLGIKVGERYEYGGFDYPPKETLDPTIPEESIVPGWVMVVNEKTYQLSPQELPPQSLPVRAAQLVSSASGLLLCVFLCILSRYIAKPGALMLVGFASYAIARFGLEIVRNDEGGQFNTTLTISQWVSIVIFVVSIAALVYLYRRVDQPGGAELETA